MITSDGIEIPSLNHTTASKKKNGKVVSFAANTSNGTIWEYNEDWVSIIMNINKPRDKPVDNWPDCHFFGIFDGHGGSACADFLRDNLH